MSQSIDWESYDRVLRLIKLLCGDFGVPARKISLNSSIFHDMGIDGKDAWDLMEKIGVEFGIEIMPQDYEKYFGDEAPAFPMGALIHRLAGNASSRSIERLELRHLIETVLVGRWVEPPDRT